MSFPDDYIVAYLPGCLTHFINISPDLDPVHHMLIPGINPWTIRLDYWKERRGICNYMTIKEVFVIIHTIEPHQVEFFVSVFALILVLNKLVKT